MSRIDRLTATIAVPNHGELPLGTLDRVSTAVTELIPNALARRFSAAGRPRSDATDRPVVLIKRLAVSAAVPASATSDEIAERLAQRVARAILTADDERQIRYASRAAHIAAFVTAVSGGTGDSWVFASFDSVRLLAPLTALRALAERYAVPVVAVLGELHRSGDLRVVLARASAAELSRTWAACLAMPHPRLTSADAIDQLAPEPTDAEQPAPPTAEATAMLLAARAITVGCSPAVAVAVATALATSGGAPLTGTLPSMRTPEGRSVAEEPTAQMPHGRDPAVFEAAGAPAFLLLPSFDKVGLGQLEPAQRALVLAVATRTAPDDPAVTLASDLSPPGERGPATWGRDPAAHDDPRGPAPGIAAVVQLALIDDDRLGLARLHRYCAAGQVIVADATSGIWLAILDAHEPLDGALIGALAALPCDDAQPDAVLTARIAADLTYLLPDQPDKASREAAVAARAGLGHFARRLAGFGASSLPYLSDRFLTPGGVIAVYDDSLWVRLPAPPLLVVLALAGLDRATITVPWLRPAVTITHQDMR